MSPIKLLTLSSCLFAATQHAAGIVKWNLVWSDEFNSNGAPNPEKWTCEEGFFRNDELQCYTSRPENARVENGVLVIEGRKEHIKNPKRLPGSTHPKHMNEYADYTSASLDSKAHWTYGRIEVRAKLPEGQGVWPAIWTLGINNETDWWPKCGEIDIMEFVGNEPDTIYSTIHFGEDEEHHCSNQGKIQTGKPYDDFHVYAIEWSKDHINFFFDDKKYHTVNLNEAGSGKNNPFRNPHFLRINLALGGTWGGKLDDSILPQKYLIDYVRVYQRKQIPDF